MKTKCRFFPLFSLLVISFIYISVGETNEGDDIFFPTERGNCSIQAEEETVPLITEYSYNWPNIPPANRCVRAAPDIIEEEKCDCPTCPRIYVIAINGINSDFDSPFYRWLPQNIPSGPTWWIDPYNYEECEWCLADPSEAAERINQKIDEIKAADPCAKVIVIGHSLGGVAAWFSKEKADCLVMIDPPTQCRPFGVFVCNSMNDICRASNGGIRNHPGYIPTVFHTPFGKPKPGEDFCDDQRRIKDKIDECYARLTPRCFDPASIGCLEEPVIVTVDPPPPPPPAPAAETEEGTH